jgi:hypothetical protein
LQKKQLIAPDPGASPGEQGRGVLAVSQDGKQVARTDSKGAVNNVDVDSARVVLSVPPLDPSTSKLHRSGMFSYSRFSPDGKFFADGAGIGPDRLRIWEVGTGRQVLASQASSFAFAPDGKVVLGFMLKEAPVLHDLASGKEDAFDAAPAETP